MLKIKVKKTNFGKQSGEYPVVRITAEHYAEIQSIAAATNRTLRETIALVLDYALDRVQIDE